MGTKVTVKATEVMGTKVRVKVMAINIVDTRNTTVVMATRIKAMVITEVMDTNTVTNMAGIIIKTEAMLMVDTTDLTIGHTTDPTLTIQDPIQFIPMYLFRLT